MTSLENIADSVRSTAKTVGKHLVYTALLCTTSLSQAQTIVPISSVTEDGKDCVATQYVEGDQAPRLIDCRDIKEGSSSKKPKKKSVKDKQQQPLYNASLATPTEQVSPYFNTCFAGCMLINNDEDQCRTSCKETEPKSLEPATPTEQTTGPDLKLNLDMLNEMEAESPVIATQTAQAVEPEKASLFGFTGAIKPLYTQSIHDMSGSKIEYNGPGIELVALPEWRFKKGSVKLFVPALKYGYNSFNSVRANGQAIEGNSAHQHEFDAGILLGIKTLHNPNSRSGDLAFLIGGTFFGQFQSLTYNLMEFNQQVLGAKPQLYLAVPRLISASERFSMGLEGNGIVEIADVAQQNEDSTTDKGAHYNLQADVKLIASISEIVGLKLGWQGTSQYVLEPRFGNQFGSHLTAEASYQKNSLIIGARGWIPYGVESSKKGASIFGSYGPVALEASVLQDSLAISTGNGDKRANNAAIYSLSAVISSGLDDLAIQAARNLESQFRTH